MGTDNARYLFFYKQNLHNLETIHTTFRKFHRNMFYDTTQELAFNAEEFNFQPGSNGVVKGNGRGRVFYVAEQGVAKRWGWAGWAGV